jgi:hypothetical protein
VRAIVFNDRVRQHPLARARPGFHAQTIASSVDRGEFGRLAPWHGRRN